MPSISFAQWQYGAGSAAVSPEYLDAGRGSPILHAALDANIADLAITASSSTPGMGAVGKALLARAQGDFKASASAARKCVDEALHVPDGAQIALVCAQVGASDLLMQGDLKGWAKATLNSWTRLKSALSAATGKSNLTTTAVETARVVLDGAPDAATTVTWKPRVDRLPFRTPAPAGQGRGRRFTVDVTVNGKPFRWLFDTGVQASALSRSDAAALGLSVKAANLGARDPGGRLVKSVGLVDVEELVVGGLELRHARMLAIDGAMSVLGIDLIHQMGSFQRISRSGISFPEQATECTQPMAYQLDFTGLRQYGLVIEPILGGERRRSLLDTGDNNDVVVRSSDSRWLSGAKASTATVTTLARQMTVPYHQGSISVRAGDQEIPAAVSIFDADGKEPSWTLGAGVLEQADVLLDQRSHTACLTVRS
jgi:Predicted aspartyl protease